MSIVKVTLPGGEIPVNGKQVSFVAPCPCTVTDGLQIDGENYTIVDALCNCVTGKGGRWDVGAVVSVILDVDKKLAYLQNGNLAAEQVALAEATATELGLPAGASVDDALCSLLPRVGDTLTTARTDLGDKWVLCNGEPVSADEYPELCATLPSSGFLNVGRADAPTGLDVRRWKKEGAYYVFVVGNNTFYYSTSPKGTYKTKTITHSSGYNLQDVEYVNGLWVATFYNGYYFMFSTASTIDGTWTAHTNTTGNVSTRVVMSSKSNMVYCYGKYILCYYDNNYAEQYCLSTTDFVNFTNKRVQMDHSYPFVMSLAVYNNELYATFLAANGNYGIAMKIASTLSSYSLSANFGSTSNMTYMTESDGEFFVITDSTLRRTRDFKTWTTLTIPHNTNQLRPVVIGNVLYCLYQASSGTRMILGGYDLTTGASTYGGVVTLGETCTFYGGEEYKGNPFFAAVGTINGVSYDNTFVARGAYCKLPTISIDGAYTYIKAKG